MVLADAWNAWDDQPAKNNTRAKCAETMAPFLRAEEGSEGRRGRGWVSGIFGMYLPRTHLTSVLIGKDHI